MTHTRKWASALYLVLLSINCSVSNAEVLVTDNLVTNTQQSWSGCSTPTSGAFWGGTSGGPCPGVGETGQIIFSWGQYTLSQSIAINQALANSGSGLQVDGYNYSWWVKNSNINGQQPGGYDPIAYVDINLYNKSGSLLETDRYNYGYQLNNWTFFSGTRTYSNPYASSELGNIQLSVTGKDSGFWAGYYGAEFSNFSLSLNYSVKPTTMPKSFTPTEPGAASIDPTKIDATQTDVGGVEMSTSGSLQVPDNVPQAVRESRKSNSTSIGLTIIAKNREKERAIANRQYELVTESNEQLALSFTRAGSVLGAESNSLSNPANPLGSFMQGGTRPLENTQLDSNNSTVKKNVQNNELAGGVNINQIAQTPVGFESYLGTIPDGRMYEPREIYKGQRNVDNANATRFLNGKNDVIHQMMIEQQYNLGK